MLEIGKYSGDIERIMPLLLLGDESEEMIRRYIFSGNIFVGTDDGRIIAVCVAVEDADGWIEIKNLAVSPLRQRQGIGSAMLTYVEMQYPGERFRLGTGETPSTLHFYNSCGYHYSHSIKNFFIDNYDHPIVEDGIQLRDMLYLVKEPYQHLG